MKENNPQEDEEEEEDDEEEIAQNLNRNIYDYLEQLDNKENKENREKKENIIKEEEEELFDENDEDLKKLVPLNEEKYNYLLNCGINFFKLGPKIIKLIINYMKNYLLLNNFNDNNEDFDKFNTLLIKKMKSH